MVISTKVCASCKNQSTSLSKEPCKSCSYDDPNYPTGWSPAVINFEEELNKAALDVLKDAGMVNPQVEKYDGSAKTSKHYQVGRMQPIEILQDYLTPEEFNGFCKGNIIKYTLRCGHKDEAVREITKVVQYGKWLIKSLKGEQIKPMEDD